MLSKEVHLASKSLLWTERPTTDCCTCASAVVFLILKGRPHKLYTIPSLNQTVRTRPSSTMSNFADLMLGNGAAEDPMEDRNYSDPFLNTYMESNIYMNSNVTEESSNTFCQSEKEELPHEIESIWPGDPCLFSLDKKEKEKTESENCRAEEKKTQRVHKQKRKKKTEQKEVAKKRKLTLESQRIGPDSASQTKWADYCYLPKYPTRTKQRSKRKACVVSLENNKVYCGPLTKCQQQLLKFKTDVLCSIMKDPHTPKFSVSGNVLMFSIPNPDHLSKDITAKVIEIRKANILAKERNSVLFAQPVSILKHCLIRYILDIGDTGLSYLVFDGLNKNFINWNVLKEWKNAGTCQDRVGRFFENHKQRENQLLVLRCKVLQHKSSLLKFLEELDVSAIEKTGLKYGVENFHVSMIKSNIDEISYMLLNLNETNILNFGGEGPLY